MLPLPRTRTRAYKSLVRERQAGDTRRRIVEATRHLLQSDGYAGMTIEEIAQRAEVSAQSVYAIFKSKTGILTELLDQSTFGADYEDAVRKVHLPGNGGREPQTDFGVAGDAQSATFDLLRGAGVVAPKL